MLDVLHRLFCVEFLFFDPAEPRADRIPQVLAPLHDVLKDLVEGRQRHLRIIQNLVCADRRTVSRDLPWNLLLPKISALRFLLPLAQLLRHILVGLVGDQLADQLVSRIDLLAFLILLRRQQHPRLDIEQLRRHHEEFAHPVQFRLQRLHRRQVRHILLRNQRDRDVVDIDFILIDQVEQKIHRTLIRLQFDLNRHSVLLQSQGFPATPVC